MAERGSVPADIMKMNRQWLEELYDQLKNKQDEINRLQQEYNQISHNIELLEALLASAEGQELETGRMKEAAAGENFREKEPLKPETDEDKELRGDRLRDEIVRVLQEAYPDDVYYREILRRIRLKGYQVAGKNPGLNIIAHLAKEPRVVRAEKRGMYRLEESFINEWQGGLAAGKQDKGK
ncbi:hypothetical protein [Syntrophomonas erecta]